jgi:protein-arginine kinase activator protein McsA
MAQTVHGYRYDYSKSKYTNARNAIKIVCPDHGLFEQIARTHIHQKSGCPLCSHNVPYSPEEFIAACAKKHNGKYDYSAVQFESLKDKISILCHFHGEFKQQAGSHLHQGHGCPKCANKLKYKKSSKIENKWLSSIALPEDRNHRQVRIEVNNQLFVVDGFDPVSKTVYEFYGDYWHGNPKVYNPSGINPNASTTFLALYEQTMCKEQALRDAGFTVVTMWEYDFKNQR